MSLLCSKSFNVSHAMNSTNQIPGTGLRAINTLASLIYLLLSPSLTFLQFHQTVFSKHAQYSHTSALLYYLSPLTRTLLSLTSPWLIPSPPSDLCSSHHLNRQCSPTYLKWHFTPSPHTLNYLLSYSMFPPQHSSSPNILLIIFIKFIAFVPH